MSNLIENWNSTYPEHPIGEGLQCLGAIMRLSRKFQTAYARSLGERAIDKHAMDTLHQLLAIELNARQKRGATATELAELSDVTAATMTHRLDQMVARGFVIKRPSTTDRRALQVEITEHGRIAAFDALAVKQELAEFLTAGMNEVEVSRLRDEIERLETRLHSVLL